MKDLSILPSPDGDNTAENISIVYSTELNNEYTEDEELIGFVLGFNLFGYGKDEACIMNCSIWASNPAYSVRVGFGHKAKEYSLWAKDKVLISKNVKKLSAPFVKKNKWKMVVKNVKDIGDGFVLTKKWKLTITKKQGSFYVETVEENVKEYQTNQRMKVILKKRLAKEKL